MEDLEQQLRLALERLNHHTVARVITEVYTEDGLREFAFALDLAREHPEE